MTAATFAELSPDLAISAIAAYLAASAEAFACAILCCAVTYIL
jgi:hypothetical protein